MRYIDITELRPPVGWSNRAKVAKEKIASGEDPNDHSQVWRDLKDQLAELLHDKCWYCETPIPRSDNAVDHFRPKGRVHDSARPHSGYRWLAVDISNFRYSCTFCNCKRIDIDGGTVGGKADCFPLQDESQRVFAEGSLNGEMPLLLDPCIFDDCKLLGCQREDGRPCATSSDSLDKMRAETSIKIYHLHHEPTCKLRHAAAIRLLSDIDSAKRHFSLIQNDTQENEYFKSAAEKILRAICRKAEFSGDMRFILRGERSAQHPWIQELLEA